MKAKRRSLGPVAISAAVVLGSMQISQASFQGELPVPAPLSKAAGIKIDAKGNIMGLIPSFDAAPSKDWFNMSPSQGAEGVSSNETYEKYGLPKGKPVIVAVIDGGVDVTHEDLKGKLWINEGEIPNDGIDNDKNGYVDDVFGWNFIGAKEGVASFKPVDGKSFDSGVLYEGKPELQVDGDTLEVTREYKRMVALSQTRILTKKEQAYFETVLAAFNADPSGGDDANYYYNVSLDTRRDIVKDHYFNFSERNYGNNDVIGPDASHGTHVAGIISGARNGIGTNGIATNVKIMAVRVVPNGDERDKDVANGIRYAADNGAQVINMSFGKGFSYNKRAVDAAVRYAQSKGVIMVHAAGNDAENNDVSPNFPNRFRVSKKGKQSYFSTFPLWIEVGASTSSTDDLVAYFSNYGKRTVDVFGPGYQVYSSIPGNRYAYFSGTSMASPAVAGVVAALKSFYPKLSSRQIRHAVLASSRKYKKLLVDFSQTQAEVPFRSLSRSGGIADLLSAVEYVQEGAENIGETVEFTGSL